MENHNSNKTPQPALNYTLHILRMVTISALSYILLVWLLKIRPDEWIIGLTWISVHLTIHRTLHIWSSTP